MAHKCNITAVYDLTRLYCEHCLRFFASNNRHSVVRDRIKYKQREQHKPVRSHTVIFLSNTKN